MALHLTVHSPVGAPQEDFFWTSKNLELQPDDRSEDASDALDSVRFILQELPILSEDPDVAAALRQADPRRFPSVQRVCEAYNRSLRAARSALGADGFNSLVPQRAATAHLKHIISLAYNRAVEDPDVLNRYAAFSPEVYGETSFELITHMMDSVAFSPEDTFIDLGSGVGQVVVQVAAATRVSRCIGIEKADIPASYASRLADEFKRWMAFFGKEYQPFELKHDDFLADGYRELISNCTVIFVNNFAFGPRVDHDLKERFSSLKEGARIVSSKVFCPLNFRITDRNLSDIGSILTVRELEPLESAVSWTNTPFSYFLHMVDFKQLEHYFASLKNPELKQAAAATAVRRDRRGRPIDLTKSASAACLTTGGGGGAAAAPSTSRQSSTNGVGGTTSSNICHQSDSSEDATYASAAASAAASDFICSAPASVSASGLGNHRGGGGGGGGNPAMRRRVKGVRIKREAGLGLLHACTLASHSRPVPHANAPALSAFAEAYTGSRHCREFAGLDAVRASADLRDTAYSLERHPDTMTQPPGLDRLLGAIGAVVTAFLRQTARPDFRQDLLKRVKAERERRQRLKRACEVARRQVDALVREGLTSLNLRLRELGIETDRPAHFFNASRRTLRANKELKDRRDKLKAEIEQLERGACGANGGATSLLDSHLTQMIRNALTH